MKEFDFSAHRPAAASGTKTLTDLRQVAASDGLPRSTVLDCRLSHCLLSAKHLKDVTFQGGSVQHCRLEFCRLTNAFFDRVDLTGTRFVRCDLRNAQFVRCKMWYVRFERCELDYARVLDSAPDETNLRRDFLKALRVNAEETGEKAWVDRLLAMELRTQEHELLNIVVGKSDYYRTKYAALARFGAARRLLLLVLNRLWWGYGLRLSSLAASGTAVVFLFAALAHWLPATFRIHGAPDAVRLGWPDAFYLSVVGFANGDLGDVRPADVLARALLAGEGLLGILFLGFFAAAMYRRLAK